jgi:hypothetical protein
MALVSLGWIFFRANSPVQAWEMFAAVLSPASYGVKHLSGSLYLLVAAVVVGYAATLLVAESMRRAEEAGQLRSRMMVLLGRKRWYWLPPLYVLFLALVLMVTLTQSTTTAQFMYRAF